MTHTEELTVEKELSDFLRSLDAVGLGDCLCEQNAEDYVRPCPVHSPSESERELADKCLDRAEAVVDPETRKILAQASETIDRQVRRQDRLVRYLRKLASPLPHPPEVQGEHFNKPPYHGSNPGPHGEGLDYQTEVQETPNATTIAAIEELESGGGEVVVAAPPPKSEDALGEDIISELRGCCDWPLKALSAFLFCEKEGKWVDEVEDVVQLLYRTASLIEAQERENKHFGYTLEKIAHGSYDGPNSAYFAREALKTVDKEFLYPTNTRLAAAKEQLDAQTSRANSLSGELVKANLKLTAAQGQISRLKEALEEARRQIECLWRACEQVSRKESGFGPARKICRDAIEQAAHSKE